MGKSSLIIHTSYLQITTIYTTCRLAGKGSSTLKLKQHNVKHHSLYNVCAFSDLYCVKVENHQCVEYRGNLIGKC